MLLFAQRDSHPPGPLLASFPYLEDNGLIILFEVEGKDVCVHECGTALAEDVDRFLQELDLDPRHVVLLHLLHLLLHLGVELVLEAQALHVVHVTVAVEEVPLQGRSGPLCEFPLGGKEGGREHYNRVATTKARHLGALSVGGKRRREGRLGLTDAV